jgi:hypothetical protein
MSIREGHVSEPTYLPLLNSIAVNEAKGERLLAAWADATPDKDLAECLRFVAIREGEHAMAFTKRMCELGYPVNESTAYQVFKDFDKTLAIVKSNASDAEKIRKLNGDRSRDAERKDPFGAFFNDQSIDPQTGALLGRYIAEERDSGRRLEAAYAKASGGGMGKSEIAELRGAIEALCAEVAALRKVRSAA